MHRRGVCKILGGKTILARKDAQYLPRPLAPPPPKLRILRAPNCAFCAPATNWTWGVQNASVQAPNTGGGSGAICLNGASISFTADATNYAQVRIPGASTTKPQFVVDDGLWSGSLLREIDVSGHRILYSYV